MQLRPQVVAALENNLQNYPPMKLLLLPTFDDQPYFKRFAALIGTAKCSVKLEDAIGVTQIGQWARLADADALVCTNPHNLKIILEGMPDYVPANTRKQITLDDYAGSLLYLFVAGKKLPVLVLNPLMHLVRTDSGEFLARRYLSKLLTPERWPAPYAFQYKVVDVADAAAVIARLAQARLISADIETPYPDNPLRAINCVGYAGWFPDTNTIECYVFPTLEEWGMAAVAQINDNPVAKLTQGGLYDNAYFMRWGVPLRNFLHDTLNLFHCYYSELPKRLDFITSFAVRDVRYWKDDGTNGLESYYRYNARDCWATMCSYLALIAEVPSYAVRNYLQEFPLIFPCITCELEGIAADMERWKQVQGKLEKDSEEELRTIRVMVAEPAFNPRSPKQMLNLFKVLGLGHLTSADANNMKVAMASSPFNNALLSKIDEWKKDAKLLSTYLVDEKLWNNRLFYRLDPAGTDTGRLASRASSFNCGLQIQNMPRGEEVKQCFISDAGWTFGSTDGEQAEARCVGYMSGETKLIDLVESPHDYHSWNAAAFFGVPYEEIYDEPTKTKLNEELRDLSKRTNHGANYNMGPSVMLATMGPKNVLKAKIILKLPVKWSLLKVCEHLLAVYADTYPGVKREWYQWIVKTITTTGRLVSALGWTRVFFGKPADNKLALNAAVAHGPQNLSVGIINRGFYAVWREQIYGALAFRVRIKAQIHDEIFFQFRDGDLAAAQRVQEIATIPVDVTDCKDITRTMVIPMALSTGKKGKVAKRWSECK